jgi:hypothetical protein
MATTSNYSIYYPSSTDNIAPLESHFSTLATSVDTALVNNKFKSVATASALAALTASSYSGFVVTVQDSGAQWFSNGTTWSLHNIPEVANNTARSALYVSPVVPSFGDTVFNISTGMAETYYTLYNVSTNPGGASTAGWYAVDAVASTVYVRDSTRRDAIFTAPVQGMTVFNNALGWNETYYELYNVSTNPGGATPAGWYPNTGNLPKLSYGTNATLTIGTSPTAPSPMIFSTAVTQSVATGITFNATTGVATIVTPGIYRIYGQTHWQGTAAGTRAFYIVKNGTVFLTNYQQPSSPGGWPIIYSGKLVAGDTINLAMSAATATTTYPGGTYWSTFSMDYMGPAQ